MVGPGPSGQPGTRGLSLFLRDAHARSYAGSKEGYAELKTFLSQFPFFSFDGVGIGYSASSSLGNWAIGQLSVNKDHVSPGLRPDRALGIGSTYLILCHLHLHNQSNADGRNGKVTD